MVERNDIAKGIEKARVPLLRDQYVAEEEDGEIKRDISLQENTPISRGFFLGISSEYAYSDEIPRKMSLEKNSSKFHFPSKFPRNFVTEFRGNIFPRKFRGLTFVEEVLGIY
ncbi:Uncharacterized protein Rs2_06471 [Raphanus sativus]|nr:Uncharacterized protein Rs2_06471 [Raphanus sativus]